MATAFCNSIFLLNGNSCQMFDACIFMTLNETDVDALTHTKQLLNLLCIVYQTLNHSLKAGEQSAPAECKMTSVMSLDGVTSF